MRFLAPSFLCVALVTFFLPWLEVRHNFDGFGVVILSQSGLEAIWGGVSGGIGFGFDSLGQTAVSLSAAPLMVVYVVMIVAGIGLGFVFGGLGTRVATPLRVTLVASCTGITLVVLVVQMIVGFPFAAWVGAAPSNQATYGLTQKWGYGFGFWLELSALAAAVVGIFLDAAKSPRPRRKRPKRRRRDDDD